MHEGIRNSAPGNAGVSPRGQHATRTVSDSNGVHFMPNQKGGQALATGGVYDGKTMQILHAASLPP